MRGQNIKTNFIFQFSYQILIYVVPLIISPFLTRRLGGEALGVYTYSYSIAYYFLLFANLGIKTHGQRIIAVSRDDNEMLRKKFWSLLYLHILFSAISLIVYLACCLFVFKNNTNIFFLQGLLVLSAMFDITWLFFGLENFKSVVFKNIFVKLFECVLIFALIREADDLWIYTLIMAGSVFLGHFVMLPQAMKLVKPIRVTVTDMRIHIKPMAVLFVAVVASTLYTVFDKTLLGIFSSNINSVAFYEYSDKIITIPKQIIAVLGAVMLPRACKNFADDNIEGLKKNISISLIIVSIISMGAIFGLAAVSNKLSVVYYGHEFEECGTIIKYMTPLIYIVMIGDVFRSQYIIPSNNDRIYVSSLIISAVINIVISIVFIPIYGVVGAIMGTTVAEMFGLLYQGYHSRKIVKILEVVKDSLIFAADGILMFVIVKFIDNNTGLTGFSLLLEIAVGVVTYAVFVLISLKLFMADVWINLLSQVKKYHNDRED